MKKIFCTLLVLIASVVSAYATDGITAKNVIIPKGGTALLEIDLTSETQQYGGFQFKLQLPAGVSISEIKKTSRLTSVETENDNFTASKNLIDEDNNVYQVLVYIANSDKEHLIEIPGTSGAVINIKLAADNTVNVGDVLTGYLNTVYLTTIGAQQTDAEDTEFSITIDSRVTLDENSTIAPNASNGPVDVRVLRTIKANEWSTICLPFDMSAEQVKAAFGDDVLLEDYAGVNTTEDADENVVGLQFNFVNTTSVEANHPYLIKVLNPVNEFTVDGVTIDPDDAIVTSVALRTGTGTKKDPYVYYYDYFTGTYVANTVLPAVSLFLSGNQFWYSTGATKSKGYRAYFELYFNLTDVEDAYGNNTRITMNFYDSYPTGINEVSVQEDDRYYNLSGQRVKPEKKGLYIQNGKKKIIK